VILIAGQLAVSLENAMVYASLEHKVAERTEALAAANERLELLTVTDPLTALANRRRLTETLQAEWNRARRTGEAVGAFMVDIDHFKLLNDRYGHLVGDSCLRQVAGALVETVRVTDLVARYGGEEFAVILPGTETEHTLMVAERARKAVEALGLENADAPSGVVTVSIGVAAVRPSSGVTAEELIAAADAALYEAKRCGRNNVRVHH
jgi:diguanylate cyclase (GGDEF)-like protein